MSWACRERREPGRHRAHVRGQRAGAALRVRRRLSRFAALLVTSALVAKADCTLDAVISTERLGRQFAEHRLVIVREAPEMPEAPECGGLRHRVPRLQRAPRPVKTHIAKERRGPEPQNILEAILQRSAANAEQATKIGNRKGSVGMVRRCVRVRRRQSAIAGLGRSAVRSRAGRRSAPEPSLKPSPA